MNTYTYKIKKNIRKHLQIKKLFIVSVLICSLLVPLPVKPFTPIQRTAFCLGISAGLGLTVGAVIAYKQNRDKSPKEKAIAIIKKAVAGAFIGSIAIGIPMRYVLFASQQQQNNPPVDSNNPDPNQLNQPDQIIKKLCPACRQNKPERSFIPLKCSSHHEVCSTCFSFTYNLGTTLCDLCPKNPNPQPQPPVNPNADGKPDSNQSTEVQKVCPACSNAYASSAFMKMKLCEHEMCLACITTNNETTTDLDAGPCVLCKKDNPNQAPGIYQIDECNICSNEKPIMPVPCGKCTYNVCKECAIGWFYDTTEEDEKIISIDSFKGSTCPQCRQNIPNEKQKELHSFVAFKDNNQSNHWDQPHPAPSQGHIIINDTQYSFDATRTQSMSDFFNRAFWQ